MYNQNHIYQIAFSLVKGIGCITGRQILEHIQDASLLFTEKKQVLEKIPGLSRNILAGISSDVLCRAEKELKFIEKHRIETYFIAKPDYPKRLKECVDAPLLLYYKGNADLSSSRIISIVGTRNATAYGKEIIDNLTSDIKNTFPEAIILSGLAYGIDIAAHKAALKQGIQTVGVLAHGLDRIYPFCHKNIAAEMVSKGGLLTEYMSETNPDRPNFIKRNRIIAGLSNCTVVVESAEKGGSLITAEISHSYNHDVFAFPGKVGDKYSQGCNRLIKHQKATLICHADDLFREMNWSNTQAKTPVQRSFLIDFSDDEQKIIDLLSKEKNMHLNTLCVTLDLAMSKLSPLLFELEMKGVISCMPGGIYALR